MLHNKMWGRGFCAALCVVGFGLVAALIRSGGSGLAADAAFPEVTLEPIDLSGVSTAPDAVERLSSEIRVLLDKIVESPPVHSRLTLLNSDGTSRTIVTKAVVEKMRCEGHKIITLEATAVPSIGTMLEMIEAECKTLRQIRSYDPADGSSVTLLTMQSEAEKFADFLDFLPLEGRLYLFGSSYDEKTSSVYIRITTLPGNGESATSAVIAQASGDRGPRNLLVSDGWLYYLAGQSTGDPLNTTANAVFRVDLATMKRQKVLEDSNIRNFCVAKDIGVLAYVKWDIAEDQASLLFGLAPLDGSSVAAMMSLPMGEVSAVEGGPWYDDNEQAFVLKTWQTSGNGKSSPKYVRVVLPNQ